jgi:hypothetical protein
VELRAARVQIANGHERLLERASRLGLDTDELGFIDARAPQEARAIIGVALDELEREAGLSPSVLDELKQQAAVVIELGPIERVTRELLQLRTREIIALDGGAHPSNRSGEALRHLELPVSQELHVGYCSSWPIASLRLACRCLGRASPKRIGPSRLGLWSIWGLPLGFL